MKEYYDKLADLAIKVGVQLQNNEEVYISSDVEAAEFARVLVRRCYENGARKVTVRWSDEVVARTVFEREDEEALTDIERWKVVQTEDIVDRKAVCIHIESSDPNVFVGISPKKMGARARAMSKLTEKYHDNTMSGKTRWTIIPFPGQKWAEQVFPDKKGQQAKDALFVEIGKAVRLFESDPIAAWAEHQANIDRRKKVLSSSKIKTLHYKNSLGTDFTIGMPKNYIFEGGADKNPYGYYYTANLPTEEVFSAPHKMTASGRVVATKPLIYRGNRIDDFWIEFENGKVKDFAAKVGQEHLAQLIGSDEGSCYLGEVALVGFDSPIQNQGILFYSTLFDENASCHLALGRAYPSCVLGGGDMNSEQRLEAGLNFSYEHEDFMIGSKDLSIVATTESGEEIVVFENGNWAF
jgi:aminopeptidase